MEDEVIITDEIAQEIMDDPHPLQAADEGWATLGRGDANAESDEDTATDAGVSQPEDEDELVGEDGEDAKDEDADDTEEVSGEEGEAKPDEAEAKQDNPESKQEKNLRVLRESHKELTSLRERIGDAEPILGETVNLAKAFIGGDADAIAEAASEVSKAGFANLIRGALDNLAEDFIAEKNGLSRADFDARLAVKTAPAKMSDTLKESLEYLEPEVRAEIEEVFKTFAQMEQEQKHAKSLMDKEREKAAAAAERSFNEGFSADVDGILNGMLEKLSITPASPDYKAQHAAINAIVDALHPGIRDAYKKHFRTGEKAPKALTRSQLERATAQAVKTFFGERAATAKPAAVTAPPKATGPSTGKPANNPPAVPQVRKSAPAKAKPKINTGRITPSLLADIAAGVDKYFEAGT